MQILGFSPRVYEEVGRFFREHPVVEMQVRRAADMASPCVPLGDGECLKCGARIVLGRVFTEALAQNMSGLGEELPAKSVPGDLLGAIEFRHAWDQATRSTYCGGRIVFAQEVAVGQR